ncbi:MAG TPA: hypothetical protein VMA77_17710 [Solirubrobacteraceae bacterium]|nr:hypothetical protein [Solirubrobacteraceae bacterium]
MSLEFLSPSAAIDGGAIARSPMERLAAIAGARFEVRDGWNVAVDYPGEDRAREAVGWADLSHLRKLEVRGDAIGGEFGTATRAGDAWWCRLTGDRALIVGGSGSNYVHTEVSSRGRGWGPELAGALDVTTCFAALTIVGPQARETIARFCALDLRPLKAPPQSFRPGSIARQPGMILVEAENRFLLLFGWAVAEYMWTVVEDAARPLGGGPVGVDALVGVAAGA